MALTSSSRPFVAVWNASHHAAGSTSVPSGCGARPVRTISPVSASHTTTLVDWVDESTPATSSAVIGLPLCDVFDDLDRGAGVERGLDLLGGRGLAGDQQVVVADVTVRVGGGAAELRVVDDQDRPVGDPEGRLLELGVVAVGVEEPPDGDGGDRDERDVGAEGVEQAEDLGAGAGVVLGRVPAARQHDVDLRAEQ